MDKWVKEFTDIETYNKEAMIIQRYSTLTCPNCGHQKSEEMPTDGCQFFYECENCKTVLRPNKGDCCVYCSFGSVKCPSKQTEEFLSGMSGINDNL